ncbi:type VII secretion protein EccB [Mycobacterium sp. 852002-51057_SCH5723018]|uniref:type VII secretion protein EccB n=1 Tax=Mycobacterium sp. 852002-51057_SCH5723018 TaxID=1834094 RepID=UPI0007FEC569|nr:type VII secretion protein EccB [Mycobacterium sp. 852002-51057_SCH5723018]OBG22372.1 type VII secretion protein EccB [Mycobacterium sp. 852002-51057_SCH5723018]
MDRSPPCPPTTGLQVSGYRFLLRRIECALLGRDIGAVNESLRARSASVATGCVLAAIAVAGCAVLGLLRPRADLDHARIVLAQPSGALYVRVGDTWHPALNLASARLIAGTADDPRPVRETDLRRTKRGPLLGIPGAPQLLGNPLPDAESAWTICDTDGAGATTVVVGTADVSAARRLAADQAMLVAPPAGSPAQLLYNGQRAVVDLADAAVLRALRLEGRAPRVVSPSLLNAVPEAPPIGVPRIPGAGGPAAGLPGFPIGSVLRISRGDGEEYYVVLASGVQRIGRVAADLLRFRNSHGTAEAIAVAPDAIRATGIVNTLPVAGYPERAPTLVDGGTTVCVAWRPAPSGNADIAFMTGSGLPVPPGQVPVSLAQADGRGPALDAAYLPPGRSAYVRGNGRVGTRYLVIDTGVRFAIHDDEAERDLGLPAPIAAPWPVLTTLPSGPELARQSALAARDTVAGP